jgi:nucleoside-diphosphate-sugar epimerase
MKVAVTGASGFVGRHVVDALLARGLDVVAVLRTARDDLPAAVATVTLDIGDAGDDVFARLHHPDVLVHLAWGGLPNYRAVTHFDDELPRQFAFLSRCLDGGLRRLIVAGTCLEYGLREGRLDESMPAQPTVAYARAKVELHRLLDSRPDRGGFELAWLRLFYLYGRGQAGSSLYAQLQAAIAAGKPAFAMSNGEQTRDFLPIETAATRIAAIAAGKGDAGTVNVCSGEPVTVLEQVRRWLREWQADIALDRGAYPVPDYEPFAFWGSTDRLDRLSPAQ